MKRSQLVRRVRLLVVLTRPAVVMLVGLFAAVGLGQAGRANDAGLFAPTLVAVFGALLFAVAVNDLADEAIDRVNLRDSARPLVAGTGTRTEMKVVAATAGTLALVAGALMSVPALVTVAAGLGFTAAYALRPVRIADRGVVAPMLLPLAYVAAPYLLGIFAVRATLTGTDLLLLAGLYAGFVGRIVLKDFRDVRGDALFGKRTFLVRHGRRATCAFSAAFLGAGFAVLPFVRDLTIALTAVYAVLFGVTLILLRALARSTNGRRDTALIAGIAILGRGMLVTLYAHFAMVAGNLSTGVASAIIVAIAAVSLGQARAMVRAGGPLTTTVVPLAWSDGARLDSVPASR